MKRVKTTGLCVPFQDAEKIRRYLREQKLLREDLKIQRDTHYLHFPVTERSNELLSYKTVTKEFEVQETLPRSYKECIRLPRTLKQKLPTSYDIVGDIILIKLPKNLLRYQRQIGNALLKTHKNIRTVCLVKPVVGELRTRDVTIIAGEKRTSTTHTEYGLRFDVDVKTTYFSPRLASERKRVAGLVKPGETVVDMFAGVAPFSIMIARYAKPKIVYTLDKNKEAVTLAKQNVKLNHVLDTVEVIHADAKDVERVLPEKADRIIMNLPFSAHTFFTHTLNIANNGCIIHYYDIIQEDEIPGRVDLLKKTAEKQNFTLTNLLIRKIKTYAPREFYIGIDITATKHADVA